MSVSPDFAPMLPPALLRIEHGFFIETAFEAVFYGMTALLYIQTVYNLVAKRGAKESWKMLTFLTIQQIAVFIGVFGNIRFQVLSFVYNREFPGGPAAFQNAFSNLPVPYAALAGFTISTWMQDVLLLYRFLVIWNGNYWLFAFPCMIFLTSVAFSLILLIQVGPHAGLLSVPRNLPTTTVFFSLSVGLNIVLTGLIVGRLLYVRYTTRGSVGRQFASHYLSTAAMIVESAALYTAVGIAQIASLQTDAAVAIGIEGMFGVMTAFAPLLIAYRISLGQGWTRNTIREASASYAEELQPARRDGGSTGADPREDIGLRSRASQARTNESSAHKEPLV